MSDPQPPSPRGQGVSDIRKVLEEVGDVMVQIDAAYMEHDLQREIPCPRCGASLNYGKAVAINGHRNAFCPTEGCEFGFME